jgi:hypothetical protein
VGPVNVKVGDFYSTIGLGAWSKSEKSTDALSLSTKVGPFTLGMYTTNGGIVGTRHVTLSNIPFNSACFATNMKYSYFLFNISASACCFLLMMFIN